ncbi:hypothetical protein ACFL2B_02885 [Patescibacteria group bacterium]
MPENIESQSQQLTPEQIEQIEAQEAKKKESPEKKKPEVKMSPAQRAEKIQRLEASIDRTKTGLNENRDKLGVPQSEEDPPSVQSTKEAIQDLQAGGKEEKDKDNRDEDTNQDVEKDQGPEEIDKEREKRIREEAAKIAREKIEQSFNKIDKADVNIMAATGRKKDGSAATGLEKLDAPSTQAMAASIKEGGSPRAAFDQLSENVKKQAMESVWSEAEKKVGGAKKEGKELRDIKGVEESKDTKKAA